MSWQNTLTQRIRSQNNDNSRISIIGIGHPLLGDDYVGCWITNQWLTQEYLSKKIQVLTAESNPENFLGPIVKFNPDHLVLLDAISGMNEAGTISLIPWTEEVMLDTYLFSTPLSKFCAFIHHETQCEITLVGINIIPSGLSTEISPTIKQAGQQVIQALQQILL